MYSNLSDQIRFEREIHNIPESALYRAALFLESLNVPYADRLAQHVWAAHSEDRSNAKSLQARVDTCDLIMNGWADFLRGQNFDCDTDEDPVMINLGLILDATSEQNRADFLSELREEVIALRAAASWGDKVLQRLERLHKFEAEQAGNPVPAGTNGQG